VRLALIGVVIGTAGALATGRVLQSQLIGVTATDPLVYAGAAALFATAALLAGLLPAWRAARVDPVNMLRAD
jgi:putative ABC transport system permease protein